MRTISACSSAKNFLAISGWKQFQVGLAGQLRRVRDAHSGRRSPGWLMTKPLFGSSFTQKVISGPIHHGLQRQALVGGRALGFEFGDVVIGDTTFRRQVSAGGAFESRRPSGSSVLQTIELLVKWFATQNDR